MKRLFSHLLALGGLAFSGCEELNTEVDTGGGEVRKKLEQLKSRGLSASEARDPGLEAELAEARKQLRLALDALAETEEPATEEVAEESVPGEVSVEGAARAVVVEEGELLEVAPKVAVPDERLGDLLHGHDHQIFFAELSKFGDWFETNDYGFVWQPSALLTDPAWRPYTRGRWVNSCLLYTSPSPRDATLSRMPSSA